MKKGTEFYNVINGHSWFVSELVTDEDVSEYISEHGYYLDIIEVTPVGWESNEY